MSSINYALAQKRYSEAISPHMQRNLFLLAMVFTDVCAVGGALAVAHWLRFTMGISLTDGDPAYNLYRNLGLVFTPLWILALYFSKLYDSNYLFVGTQEYERITQVSGLVVMVLVLITFFAETIVISRSWILLSWVSITLFLLVTRFSMRRIAYILRRHGYMHTITLVVGADAEGRAIANQLRETPTAGAEVVGFLDDQTTIGEQVDGLPVLGNISTLQQIIGRLGVEEVLLSMSALTRDQITKIYEMYAHSEAVTLRFSPGLLDLFTTGAFVREWGTVPLVSINKVRLSETEALLKRCIDFSVALVALIGFSPILLILSILVKLDSPGPIFHRRYVLGQGGRLFDALKFRTMYVDGNDILEAYPTLRDELKINQKLKEDPRVTAVGRILRRYSLDELPQLVNVLVGQMSLVGPRMITRPEQEKYGRMRLNLLTVKPGLTGLWQISGRSDLSYEERVRMDMSYIRNYSIWLDIMIILKTIPAVLRGHGAY